MFRKILFLSAAICLIPFGVKADFITGEKYFQEKNYSAAFNAFLPEANKGDYRSQYYVGYLYLYGLGVTQNSEKAIEYLTASANKNYGDAQSLLGYLYDEGSVVPLNKKKAVEFYRLAADQGDSGAMLNLGLAYYMGNGVSRDIPKAIELLSRVPMDQNPAIGRYLGEIYMNSTEPNKVEKAKNAYITSARAKDVDSFYYLGKIYESEDVQKAQPYYLYAAANRFAPAQYLLGMMYVNGEKGAEKNLILGHAWLEMAANQRYEPAVEALATIDRSLTLSQSETAREEFNRLQREVIDRVESPFIAEERSEMKRQEEEKNRPAKRRVRR